MWGRVLERGDTGLRRGLAAGLEEREDVGERSKRARRWSGNRGRDSGGQASREEKESRPEGLGTTAGIAGETGRRKTQRNGVGDDRRKRGGARTGREEEQRAAQTRNR
jgi:hypothetical protein